MNVSPLDLALPTLLAATLKDHTDVDLALTDIMELVMVLTVALGIAPIHASMVVGVLLLTLAIVPDLVTVVLFVMSISMNVKQIHVMHSPTAQIQLVDSHAVTALVVMVVMV